MKIWKNIAESVKSNTWTYLLGILIVFEALFILYFHYLKYPQAINAFSAFCFSLAIGACVILKYHKQPVVRVIPGKSAGNTRLLIALVFILTGGAIYFGFRADKIFAEVPIDVSISDIIPTIQIVVRRLFSGEEVYQIIQFPSYTAAVTYLPMQWLPFTLAELLRIDYRWISLALLFIAFVILVVRCGRSSKIHGTIACLLIMLTSGLILQFEDGILTTTVETMIAAFYMLFIIGLNIKNPWLRGIAMSMCLLSRYSLVLWLPLWVFIELVNHNYKPMFKTIAACAIVVICLYILPFAIHNPNAFFEGYNHYTKAAFGEWNHLDCNGHPVQLYRGIGVARWFYEYLPGYSIPERIGLLQKAHLICSLGSVLLLGIFYWFNRKSIYSKIFQMASFKIYLTIFLTFIQVPYVYLMITSIFVSIAVFAELAFYKTEEDSEKVNLRTSPITL